MWVSLPAAGPDPAGYALRRHGGRLTVARPLSRRREEAAWSRPTRSLSGDPIRKTPHMPLALGESGRSRGNSPREDEGPD